MFTYISMYGDPSLQVQSDYLLYLMKEQIACLLTLNQLCIMMVICKPFTYSSFLRRVKCSSVVLALLGSSRSHCGGTSLSQLWQCSFYFVQ